MSDLLQSVFGVSKPEGVPIALAISAAVNGYTEAEVRAAIAEGGDASRADEWISTMHASGFFASGGHLDDADCSEMQGAPGGGRNPEQILRVSSRASGDHSSRQHETDPSTFLWEELKRELQSDESDFKHRILALGDEVKRGTFNDLSHLAHATAEYIIPFSAVKDNCPWNGCKFVATTLLLLVSNTDAPSKKSAIRPECHSLGGCTVPPDRVLSAIRWPYVLSESYTKARLAAEMSGTCTALHIFLTDIEVMRNPAKRGSMFGTRPGTFAHSCIMTVSPVGVYLLQAYGPRGYTLLQNIEQHDESYPLSLTEGEAWVKRFEQISAERRGIWTKEVNEAYTHCFGVDLVSFGNMRIGSQLDAYVKVYSYEFDNNLVRENLALLPMPSTAKKPVCRDGIFAVSGPVVRSKAPDGGVKHYYVPVVLRCGFCGGSHSPSSKRCAICKTVYYCNKECQTKDWKLRHKKACKTLARGSGS